MSTIPSNLARVPTLLASQIQLGALNRTGTDLVELQGQLASGFRIARPSDDVIGAGALSVLEDRLEKRTQNVRNFTHAESVLNNVDAALADTNEILLEAKSIASSQIGVGSDAQTRENQAVVVESLLLELTNISNRKYQLVHYFGGEATSEPPFQDLLSGIRYVGTDSELDTDLPISRAVPITLSGADAFGAVSARKEGTVDLDPPLLAGTLVSDLRGTTGLGVNLASINVDVGGTDVVVDLSSANTIGDVATILQEEIDAIDPGSTVAVNAAGTGLAITPAALDVTISDQASPSTAADLGLTGITFTGGATTSGADLDPRLTDLTELADLPGLAVPPGTIRLTNLGQTRDLDLSTVETVQDLRNAVAGFGIGIRVEIADSGDRLNFFNEVSGGSMSIGEVGGGTAATDLGVRTFDLDTELADFNDGRGVQILSGNTDPVSGLADPTRDLDFRITTKDGTEVDVDIAGATTVQDVITAIEDAATAAGLVVGTDLTVDLAQTGNGLTLTDATNGGVGTTSVTQLNGSFAADDLGITGETTGATLAGTDSATVAVDGLFSRLMALRDALRDNDERGITFAGGKLDDDIARVAEVRAEVGVRARRVRDATEREEDLEILDLTLKSEIKDLDFSEAAVRFSLLQQQLQAGLTTTSQLVQLTLLDFLR